MDKSPDAFRTISEVAADLDLPQHVLRFWETRFVQIKPLKRGGGRRYYRPDDVELLKGIRHLLYGEGYTIRGVQRILKEQGVRFVMNVWLEGAPQPPATGRRWDEATDESPVEAEPALDDADADWANPVAEAPEESDVDAPQEPIFAPDPAAEGEDRAAQALARRFAPDLEPGSEPPRPEPVRRIEPTLVALPPVAPPLPMAPVARTEPTFAISRLTPSEVPRGGIADRGRGGAVLAESSVPVGARVLARDDVRRLQSTLFELLECKRLLDQAR